MARRANASTRKAMGYGRMLAEERRLEGEIEALLGRAREHCDSSAIGTQPFQFCGTNWGTSELTYCFC